ncbi:hypothetical protein SAMN05421858_4189 [Haladaptatus litoreus]|uniref:Uncharacterized protein n=1 Tax=Haladaptatus litoreus TaxID=553468 RepID=A0A1N7EFU9_9EURY|nr:hypothetical protein SAMN05421858_4189 [Haladaptatus litoreus]
MTGYYDLILGLIPLALIGVTGIVSAAGLSLTAAVPVGATVSVLLIGHALFVNGPVASASESTSVTSSLQTNSAE